MASCRKCGRELVRNERAIYLRLVDRQAKDEELLCKACLAAHFGVSVETVDEKIEHFKRTGCLLFS